MLIDAVSDIIVTSEKDMQLPPEAATSGEGGFVSALTMIDDKIIRILDPFALLIGSEDILAKAG